MKHKKSRTLSLYGSLAAIVIVSLSILVISKEKVINTGKNPAFVDISKNKMPKEMRIKELQKYFDGLRIPVNGTKSGYKANYLMTEYQKVLANAKQFKSTNSDIEWISRGPGNVGGRTRGLIVDPDDATHSTWFAGSATGGMWKTINAGQTWECLTNDIPYQATTTLAMPTSNTNVIYLGTGESFPGSIYTTGGGVFKSTDKGQTWVQLAFTANNEDFRYVNRIIVDPDNENIVLAATYTGILKTIDGGTTWSKVFTGYNVEDIVAQPGSFDTMYAGVNSRGIMRSNDGGETWININNGLGAGRERIELAVSPINTNKIFASISNYDGTSTLFYSQNKGDGWEKGMNNDGETYDFLGQQGMYDNTIAAHPYNENVVFWGGVNLWKATITATTETGTGEVTDFYTENASSFLSFNTFTGNLYPGMNIGTNEGATEIGDTDFVSVEIRFGPGKSQKAHHFYVPELATSGVPPSDYSYQGYIDVPFEVWDVTNNRQLMCSFRDQERDNSFNLYERTGSNYGEMGREYLFINAVDYSPTTPDPNIAVQGGRSYKMLYFFWPTLTPGATWDPENLPESKIVVQYSQVNHRIINVQNVSDAYGRYDKNNQYDQSLGFGKQSIPGLHPDHHGLNIITTDKANQKFWILNSNDGGLSLSTDNGVTFTQIKNNYITTQFYGVSKKPYANEYIGGMQDNGTWQSPSYKEANETEGYYFRIGGDGFETVWHSKDSNKIMGGLYNNAIYRSLDHGKTWTDATNGIDDGDGPFITHLTAVPSVPNKIFAVGKSGIYYTFNFANTTWLKTSIADGWLGSGGAITSSHNVEVSLANDSIVWAGAAMIESENYKMFVSKNQGKSFSAVKFPAFDIPYLIAGIATHPANRNEAFVLYGAAQKPKILRTYNLGKTWEDMSGFNFDTLSANGFPDVGCFSLMVFPDDTNRIWAGTEIGIMESTDNGISWHFLDSGLPSVTVYQLFMQDNQVVAATYGRGIWTYQYKDAPVRPTSVQQHFASDDDLIAIYPNPSQGTFYVNFKSDLPGQPCLYNIYDLEGRIVKSGSFGPATENLIHLENLTDGTYIIKCILGDKHIFTKRLILKK